MLADRLAVAFREGLALPTGPLLGLYLSPDATPRDLDFARLTVLQPRRDLHDQWQGLGVSVDPESLPSGGGAVLALPRSRAEAKAAVALAASRVAAGGPIVIDGAKTDGIEALMRAVASRAPLLGRVSKAHGKLFWFAASDAFADWASGPGQIEGGWQTLPGVFSADGVDPASAALAEALPPDLHGRVVDLGAGWGYLAARVLRAGAVDTVDLVEADHRALLAARANVADRRARFHWADARHWRPDGPVDHVITNPPFHAGRRAEPALGVAFLESAATILSPSGVLWVVANRHLPYEATLADRFGQVAEIGGTSGFKILRAAQPRRRVAERRHRRPRSRIT